MSLHVDVFITDLYRLAEHCNYGLLHELIQDRLVVKEESRPYPVINDSYVINSKSG